MTLDEAIQHCKEQVHEQAKKGCYSCAEEHQQLAEWLKDYKRLLEQEPKLRQALELEKGAYNALVKNIQCADCISRQAVLDGLASIAKAKAKSDAQKSLMGRAMFFTEQLPSVTPQQRMGRWIPVSERLPKKRGAYLVTQKAAFTDYVYISAIGYALNLYDVDEYDFADKKRPGWYEYDSEWGYHELDGVIAWMPLPEPYKAESEVDS